MTLRSWSESSDRSMPVSDAIATLLVLGKPLPDRIHAEIDATLKGLFEPQFRSEWRCNLETSHLVFGSLDNATEGDIFVSTLSVSTPSGPCSYVLTVGYA